MPALFVRQKHAGSVVVRTLSERNVTMPPNEAPKQIKPKSLNDYLEVIVRQDSGGALNVVVDGDTSPMFWMAKVLG